MRIAWVAAVLLLAACACPRVRCRAPCMPVHLGTTPQIDAAVTRALTARPGEPIDVLALSSGGQNGAFSAGVLNGWRQRGRPEFRIVTGVSIGALVSSFAFLGTPEADRVMSSAFQGLDAKSALPARFLLDIPSGGSLYDPAGMQRLIRRFVSDDVIAQVARASHDGQRLLLVGSTNLDTAALHIWDMTKIARAGACDLYRRVLMASASVPGFFPPVEIHGALHCDGAVTQQVFVPELATGLAAAGHPPTTLHVVANTALYMDATCVPARAMVPQASRALLTLIRTQMIDNLWRIWGVAQSEGVALRLTFVPLDAASRSGELLTFRPEDMARMFRSGVQVGRAHDAWRDTPPRHRVESTR